MRPWLVILLLAGCANVAPDMEPAPPAPMPVTAPDFDFTTAIETVHDHGDARLHGLSFDMTQLGHDPLMSASAPGVAPGGHTEVSVVDTVDGRFAFVANFGPHRAFSIVDVTDPTAPVHVSDFLVNDVAGITRPGGGSYWDVAAFPAGDLVISSAQALASTPGLEGRDGEVGGGIYLVNTVDKSAPFMESFTPIIDGDAQVPVGVHNARGFFVDDVPYVAATTANGKTFLFEVMGDPGARTLRQASTVVGMHDTTVQVHPITGQTLLYGADGGVFITDISDPNDPVLLAQVPNGPDLAAYHLIVPSDVLIDGRHFIVSGTETTTGTPPLVTIIETTDPEAPEIVSTWRLPIDMDEYLPGAYRWSTHNFDVERGRIIMSHYHAGVWVVDVSSWTNVEAPVTLGFYQPHEAPMYVPRTPLGIDVPAVWGAVMHDGVIYAADVNTGLYALSFDGAPSPLANATVYPHNQY